LNYPKFKQIIDKKEKEQPMYASIRRYKMDPGSVEELMRRVREGFVPIISQGAGFMAYYALNAGNGVVASISVFETQAGAEESNRLAASWVKENLASTAQPALMVRPS
jgi:hypothetical protein